MRASKTTRERILDETASLVHLNGFIGTSVNDVLRMTGVTKGALYHHFPGKDSLGLAVLERDADAFMAMIDECLRAPTPQEGLERFFRAALEKHAGSGFVGGCLWGNTALEMSDTKPAYTALVARVFEQWTAKLEGTLAAGQERGQIRRDVPATALAQVTVAIIEGGIMMSRLTKQESPLRTCLETLRTLLGVAVEEKKADGGVRKTVRKR